jgi:serine/threonine protein kinase
VFEVTVEGVRRVAKKLHSNFVNPSKVSTQERESISSKFRDECVILSKLRHPNIVQFIGVHYGRRGRDDLTLIMECVNSDMDKFLEVHPNIPLPLKLSILLDISYGLVYLHERSPPIVHRDLTARNILITDKCQAKIADLGVAKVVDIQAQLVLGHTQAPGQMFYMPPEALMEESSCTTKLDIFSFGHLTLYTANQKFPNVFHVRVTSEMERQGTVQRMRRQTAIDQVGKDHCLYHTICSCLNDEPENRPTTRVLNDTLLRLSTITPAKMEDVLELVGSERTQPAAAEMEQQMSAYKLQVRPL